MVKICLWAEQNLFLVHIRDYRRGGYGKFPISEQKGIALTVDVWRKLYEMIESIKEDVEQLASQHQVEVQRR
jgi:hypothetical protein